MSSSSFTIALSTCWFGQNFEDGQQMLEEAAQMGFNWVELGHGTRISLVPGIIEAVEAEKIGVTSLHNFCPLPPGVTGAAPNLYQPSSPNSRELDSWVRHTLATLSFAKRLDVRRVVIHVGRIFRFFTDPARSLRKYAATRKIEELTEDPLWAAKRERFLKKLRKTRLIHYQRIYACFARVAEAANTAGIHLGVENREGLLELPFDKDFTEFITALEGEHPFRFWHDSGHARRKEQLGFINQRELLQATADRLIGFHLHQVTPDGRDHNSLVHPEGTIDFAMLKPFFRPDTPLVLEFSPRVPREEVVASRLWLEKLLQNT